MNIMLHLSGALAESNRLEAESEAVISFFGAGNRARAGDRWGPRQRRRDRVRRRGG
ncbi:MAG: hypothetical protein ACE5ED_03405 [Rhodothalassiaceae bacterium]